MNILKCLPKNDLFTPRQRRRAVSGPIVAILIIVVAIAIVAILIGTTTDLIGTASIVDSVDLSKQTLYAKQEFASITVKNSGTTPIEDIQAYLLITSDSDCGNEGTYRASIGVNTLTNGTKVVQEIEELNPGQSATISGDLYQTDTTTGIDCTGTNNIDDRKEYIIQVDGTGEGTQETSFTTTVRSR